MTFSQFLTSMKNVSVYNDQCWTDRLSGMTQKLERCNFLGHHKNVIDVNLFDDGTTTTLTIFQGHSGVSVNWKFYILIWFSLNFVWMWITLTRSWMYLFFFFFFFFLDFNMYSKEMIYYLVWTKLTFSFSLTKLKQHLSNFVWLQPCLGSTMSYQVLWPWPWPCFKVTGVLKTNCKVVFFKFLSSVV